MSMENQEASVSRLHPPVHDAPPGVETPVVPAELPAPAGPREKYRYQDRYDEGDPPADIPATDPIRNAGPRTRRNDSCWCGSGKKYKKCHLGRETRSPL